MSATAALSDPIHFPDICQELKLAMAEEREGIEVSIGGHFTPQLKSFSWPFYWVMHDQGLVTGGLGPNVHGSSCMRAIKSFRPMLAERFLYPLRPLLRSIEFSGLIEAACVIDRNGCGFIKSLDLEEPRYALRSVFDDSWSRSDHCYDFLAQLRLWQIGESDFCEYAVGRGSTPRRAFKEAEKSASRFRGQQVVYRTDGGRRVKEDLDFISRAGWLR